MMTPLDVRLLKIIVTNNIKHRIPKQPQANQRLVYYSPGGSQQLNAYLRFKGNVLNREQSRREVYFLSLYHQCLHPHRSGIHLGIRNTIGAIRYHSSWIWDGAEISSFSDGQGMRLCNWQLHSRIPYSIENLLISMLSRTQEL